MTISQEASRRLERSIILNFQRLTPNEDYSQRELYEKLTWKDTICGKALLMHFESYRQILFLYFDKESSICGD